MTKHESERSIFRNGSTTYFNAARFFPKDIQRDVSKLYSFVRVADDYVDSQPQNIQAFNDLVRGWHYYRGLPMPQLAHRDGDDLNSRVAKNICQLAASYHFDHEWVEAFLDSMRMDVAPTTYRTMDDTLAYVYGSAEVIGLMMAKIFGISEQGYEAAMLQGRAMQYINFLRDINEDAQLGRCYFPETELRKYRLHELSEAAATREPVAFKTFMRAQLGYYTEWQHEADRGLHYLPRRARVAVRTAVDGYNWTAQQLFRDPYLVFRGKVKPSRRRLIISGVGHIFD